VENVDIDFEIPPIPLPERASYLESYIKDGVSLAKKGKYEKAIRHLRDSKTAQEVGLHFEDDARNFILTRNLTADEADRVADKVAYNSQFNRERRSLRICEVGALGPEITGKPRPQIPQKLLQDAALIHLEEWLHALQYLTQKPLAGNEDHELDVALYLKNQGIPLTDNFLSRHSRRKYFSEIAQPPEV